MVTCPICGTQNEGDFGLTNCTSCKSPFFIQIDGSVELAGPAQTEPPQAPVEQAHQSQIYSSQSHHAIAADISDSILDDFSGDNRNADFQNEFHSAVKSQTNAGSKVAKAPPPPLPQEAQTTGESMREIADFANSESSVAREGAYRFDLTVMGIDSAEIKSEVKDALTDGRFLWDIEALLNEMQDGILIIKNLSAVKSALVVQRLKILPVDIKWEQHAIHQSV